MYNGQYAKGIVHLIVFAILVCLADENGIFGLFIAGWVFYQVIEAHHTAQARRDGTPLPNPFGLNDLGERLGFGKAWPRGAYTAARPDAAPAPDATVPPAASYPPPAPGYPPYTPPPASSWGAPWENYVPPVHPASPYRPHASAGPQSCAYPRNRFPSGRHLAHRPRRHLPHRQLRTVPRLPHPLVCSAASHRVRSLAVRPQDDGDRRRSPTTAPPPTSIRLFHALRGSIWIMLVGVLFLLDSSHILSWGRSWPLFIIVAGVMAILQRRGLQRGRCCSLPLSRSAPPPAAGATADDYDLHRSFQHARPGREISHGNQSSTLPAARTALRQ